MNFALLLSGIRKISAKCVLGLTLTLLLFVFSVYQTVWAAERLAVIKLNAVTNADLQPVTDVLDDEDWSYQVIANLNDLSAQSYPRALLLVPVKVDPGVIDAITKYIAAGGKLVLIPPADGAPDASAAALFEAIGISLSATGVSFPSQDVPLKWSAPPSQRVKNLPPGISTTDTLGVGAQVLTLAPGSVASVLAKWGNDLDAVVVTDKGALLNWPYGRELTSDVNAVALAAALNQEWPAPAPDAASAAGVSALSGEAFYNSPQLQSKLEKLRDYETRLNDAVEMALKLNVSVPVKEVQQLMLQARLPEAEFVHAFKAGNDDQARQAYDQAERLLNRAALLTTFSPRVEGRAIWVDRGAIVRSGSPVGLKKLLRKVKAAGINVIYFETVNAGFPIYPSALTMQNPAIEGWDPLKIAVEEGHRLGMEVHAWVWVFAVGNTRHNPVIGREPGYSGPLLDEKALMSEALRNAGGGLSTKGRQTEFWLSPASPKARQFLKDLFSEIVSKYDVDGLQLDYIRYPFQSSGDQMGFELAGRERFAQSTGVTLCGGMSDQARRVWIAWKTYQISSFVKEVSETLKAIRPTLRLSAAVFPMPRATRIVAIQQDWETWLDNGWVDTLSPMSYTSSPRKLKNTFLSVENATKKKAIIYPGIAIDRLDSEDLLLQVSLIRERGGLGNTLFAMSHLDDLKIQALRSGPYREHDTITPHKDPVGAMAALVGDFSTTFDAMLTKNISTQMTGDQKEAIRKDITALSQALQPLTAAAAAKTGRPPDAGTLKALAADAQALDSPLQGWFAADSKAHPYRILYFSETMARVNFLLDYLQDHASLRNAAAQGDDSFKPPVLPAVEPPVTEPALSNSVSLHEVPKAAIKKTAPKSPAASSIKKATVKTKTTHHQASISSAKKKRR